MIYFYWAMGLGFAISLAVILEVIAGKNDQSN